MYRDYETAEFIGRQSAAFVVVVLFHVMLAVAFYTGLIGRVSKQFVPPNLNIATIDTPRTREPPHLPQPLTTALKPWVPEPEYPPIDQGSSDNLGIRDTISKVPTTSTPTAPPTRVSTAVRMDPRHPLKIGREHYPDIAVRGEQEGRCVVNMTVAADGRVREATLKTSSGFSALDQACIDAVQNQRMIPATADGRPVESTVSMPIVWRLSNR
jgi:TonB family protein